MSGEKIVFTYLRPHVQGGYTSSKSRKSLVEMISQEQTQTINGFQVM